MDFVQQKNKKENTNTLPHSKRNLKSLTARNAIPKVIPRAVKTEFGVDAPIQCYPPKKKPAPQPQIPPPRLLDPPYTTGFSVTPLHSTKEDRMRHTPRGTLGSWSGERGNSTFVSNDARVAGFFPKGSSVRGIEYKEAMPDFSYFAAAEVQIDMTAVRRDNFKKADQKLAEQMSILGREPQTQKEVKAWREEHGYTWHELNDGTTIQLVPSKINSPIFTHLGGVSELK